MLLPMVCSSELGWVPFENILLEGLSQALADLFCVSVCAAEMGSSNAIERSLDTLRLSAG